MGWDAGAGYPTLLHEELWKANEEISKLKKELAEIKGIKAPRYFKFGDHRVVDLMEFKEFYLTALDDDNLAPTQRFKWCVDGDYRARGSRTLIMFRDYEGCGEKAHDKAVEVLRQIHHLLIDIC